MGRLRRTNCTPIDNVMEKYHNDIGHRLSCVFMPPLYNIDQPSEFDMLTLDPRHRNSVKRNSDWSLLNTGAMREQHDHPDVSMTDMVSSTLVNKANSSVRSSSPSTATTHSSFHHSEQDAIPGSGQDKHGLVDKLTRALFQRKHTCSRCQRRSRSCLPNKNFNGTEKHYMCGHCRETSFAIKHLFTSPSTLQTQTDSGNSSINSSFSSPAIGKLPHQTKDSGYDTATSCSTVASSYSAFVSGEGQDSHTNKQVISNNLREHIEAQNCNSHTADFHPSAISDATQRRSTPDCPKVPGVYCKPKQALDTSNCAAIVENSWDDSIGMDQFMTEGVLRQVKNRHIQNYDGYLSDYLRQHHDLDETTGLAMVRYPLSDTTNSLTARAKSTNCTHSNELAVYSVSNSDISKACCTCGSSSQPCFRLPWEGGWLCEDCLDGMY